MNPEQIERVMGLVCRYERSRHLERRALSENRDDAWQGWSGEANRVLTEIRAALTAESEGTE